MAFNYICSKHEGIFNATSKIPKIRMENLFETFVCSKRNTKNLRTFQINILLTLKRNVSSSVAYLFANLASELLLTMSALIVDISNNFYLLLLSMMPIALQGAPVNSQN